MNRMEENIQWKSSLKLALEGWGWQPAPWPCCRAPSTGVHWRAACTLLLHLGRCSPGAAAPPQYSAFLCFSFLLSIQEESIERFETKSIFILFFSLYQTAHGQLFPHGFRHVTCLYSIYLIRRNQVNFVFCMYDYDNKEIEIEITKNKKITQSCPSDTNM